MGSEDILTMGIFLGILLLGGMIFIAISLQADRKLKSRIERLESRWAGKGSATAAVATSRIALNASATGIEAVLRRIIPQPGELKKRLEQTGREIEFSKYVGSCGALAVIGFCVASFGLNYSIEMAAPFGIILGVGLPHWFTGFLIKRRAVKFTTLFPDAIDLMTRGLKSGLPVTESISAAAREIPDPVGIEFRKIIDAIKLGQTLDEALWAATARISTPEFKFFVISLSIQQETGGNLAETLQNLSEILRKREQMKLKVKAMSSEARASALIIGSLPFIMGTVLSMVNYEYVNVLWTDPRGMTMLAVGFGLIGTGSFVIAKMVRFEI